MFEYIRRILHTYNFCITIIIQAYLTISLLLTLIFFLVYAYAILFFFNF